MNCSDIAETLDNRNVEELGTSERRDIEAHLAACPTCARDWELHKAFSALTDMQEPAGFPADCRALIAAGADRSQRVRSRLVLIGVFAAVAAAAAMLTATLWQQERIPLAAVQDTVAPVSVSGGAMAQIAVPAGQKPTVTEPCSGGCGNTLERTCEVHCTCAASELQRNGCSHAGERRGNRCGQQSGHQAPESSRHQRAAVASGVEADRRRLCRNLPEPARRLRDQNQWRHGHARPGFFRWPVCLRTEARRTNAEGR